MKASESAYEASEMLKEQVTMVARERDLARLQVGVTILLYMCLLMPGTTAHCI